MSSVPSPSQVYKEFETFAPAGTPVTISEISDSFDCTEQTLRKQCEELVADGHLQTKEIGDDEQVWWRPVKEQLNIKATERPEKHLIPTDIIDVFPDLADVMMVAIDQTGEIAMANAKASEILGYTQDELVGANWFDRCVPDRLQDDIQGVFSQLIDGDIEPVERYENPVVTADGDERIIEWHNTILRDDGDIVGTLSSGLDITERKRAEEAVRDNERRLEALVEATTEGVYRISPDWSEIYELAGEGFLPDDLSNSWEEYIPDEEQARVGEAINEAIETQTPFEMEHKIKLDDGSVGWTHSGAVPIIEDGEIVEWFGTSTEITERKEREAELKRHEAYLESVSDLVTVVDEDGIIQYETPTVTEMLGYEPDERVGDPGFEYIHPDDRERIRDKLEQTVSSSGVTEYYEYRAKTKDGEWIWVESTTRNLTDDRKIDGIMMTARDITERKEQQREKDLLWQAVEKADSALVLAEPGETDNPMVYLNEAFEEMTGYPKTEAIGRDCRFLQGEHTRAEPVNELRAGIENEEPVTVELRNYRKDGTEFWNKLTVDPVYDANGNLVRYLGTQEDITERKEQERKRKEVIDRVTDAIFEVDADRQFTYVSDHAESLLDESEAELLGKELFAVFEEAQESEFEERYRTVMETREPTSFVSYYLPMDIWFDVQVYPNDDGGLSVYFRDVSDRKEREQAKERAEKQYQTLLEMAPLPIVAVDSKTDEIIEANQAAGDLIGYQPNELVGRNRETIRPDGKDKVYEKSYKKAVKEEGTFRNLTDGSPYQIETKDGRRVPAEISVKTITLDGRDVEYGILRDITDERQYQRRLSALNDVTRELLDTETQRDVKQQAVETLADLLDVPTVSFYSFDEKKWKLLPEVSKTAAESSEPPVLDLGSGVEWQAIKQAQTVVVDDVEAGEIASDFERNMRSKIAIPVADNEVLVAGDPKPDAFSGWTISLAETLSATVATALERVEREQHLKTQRKELQEIESVNERIRGITRDIVQTETRADLEQSVCERLVASNLIDFAWIGRVDLGTDVVTPQAQAGPGETYLSDVSLSMDGETDPEPSVATLQSREACYYSNTAADIQRGGWRTVAAEQGFQSVLSTPIKHEDALYGVLNVYTQTNSGYQDTFQSVLSELCDLIADTIYSMEQTALLQSEQAVELEFEIRDPTNLFFELAAEVECDLELEGVVSKPDESALAFVNCVSDQQEEVLQATDRLDGIEGANMLERADDTLVQLQVADHPLTTVLSDRGFMLRKLWAEDDTRGRLTIEVPGTTDTRQAVNLISSQYQEAQLLAKHDTESSSEPGDSSAKNILESLTPRQREVIETAYQCGYFDSPRSVTGGETAEMLDLSSATFHQHIRKVEKKLFERLLACTTTSFSIPDVSSAD